MAKLEDVLQQLGIQVQSINDAEIAARCPFHADSHPSFSMNARPKRGREGEIIPAGVWICYQCGRSGTLSMLVEQVTGETNASTTEILREIRRESIQKKADEPAPLPVLDPYTLYAKYDSFRHPPRWALDERMLDSEIVERYGVKWDRGWVIPIRGPEEDEIQGFWGWQFKRLKFVSNYPRSVKKSQTLFGLREIDTSNVALVESPLDVVRLASVGVSGVAAYGAFVSKAQIKLLTEAADQVILALDNDEEGQRQGAKIYRHLAKFLPVKQAVFPDGVKDPGEASDKQLMRIFS